MSREKIRQTDLRNFSVRIGQLLRLHPLRSGFILAALISVLLVLGCVADCKGATGPSQQAAGGAIRTQPSAVGSTLNRIQRLVGQGRLDEARHELSEAIAEFPREPTLQNFFGVVDAEQAETTAAERAFEKAIQGSPHYAGAYLNLGHLYQTMPNHRPQAIQVYRTLLKFDPANIEGNYQCALLELNEGDFHQSLTHLHKLPLLYARKPQVLAVACGDYVAIAATSDAISCVDHLLASPKLTRADVASILPVLAHSRQSGIAIHLLNELMRRGMASEGDLDQLGRLYAQGGDLPEARHAFEQLAQRKPTAVAPLLELAHVASLQEDDHGALGYLVHARALDPNNARIHFLFGMMCVRLGLQRDAYTSLKQAVALDPSNAAYIYALGAVSTESKDPRESIGYFKRYCALKPHDPRGRLALGAAYYFIHELGIARKIVAPLKQDPQTSAGAYYYLGRIDSDELNWDAATQDLEQAIHRDSRNADAYAALGAVYLHEHKYAQAEAALGSTLRLQPDHYLANLDLMVAYERTKDRRAPDQARRFASVEKQREQRARQFFETIRVVP